MRVAYTQSGADRCGQWHYRDTAHVFKTFRDDGIIIGIHHDLETILHQYFGGLDRLYDVREQRFFVTQHFQFHQLVSIQQFARQPTGAHCVAGGIAAGGIGQQCVLVRRNDFQQAGFVRVLADIGTTDGNCHDLCTTGLGSGTRLLQILVFAGTDQQAGLIFDAGDEQRVGAGMKLCLDDARHRQLTL